MFKKNIKNTDQIREIINYYADGESVENIVDKTGFESKEVFSVVFNYRFTFKKLNQLTDAELWQLLQTPVR